jgi:outer membrane lipoprotein-sorting protein
MKVIEVSCRTQAMLPVIFLLLAFSLGALAQLQQPDESSVIRGVDAAVKARLDAIEGYTVTEHYAVYRNNDEAHPVAEMTVKTIYQRDTGKSYTILSESGSEIIRKFVLDSILANEKRINEPGIRESSWLTSANYEMKLKTGGVEQVDGRDCLVLSIKPRQKAPNLIEGTMWVDSKDQSIVQIQGTASKSVSHFTGPTQMMRQYANVNGFSMATHARAASNSFLFGQTVVTIDYRDYQIQLRNSK